MVALEAGTSSGQGSAQPKCQICRKQVAKYTCPSCNLRYCSIDCFRSENHVNCSEKFYKDSIMSDVRQRNDVDSADKAKMLDMLKRLQEMGEDELNESDEESDQDELSALAGLDLDALSSEEILRHLSPQQRREFEELLADPSRAAMLLESEEDKTSYWWNAEAPGDETEDTASRPSKPAPLPRSQLVKPNSSASILSYNILAVLTAYILVIRVYGQQTSAAEQQESLLNLVPFLGEKSTLVMKGVEEAYSYVLSNLQEDLITDRRTLVLILLQDSESLTVLPKVRLMEENEQADDNAFLALSDIHRKLACRGDASRRSARKLAAQKILFYASNVDSIDRERLYQAIKKRQRTLEIEEAGATKFQESVADSKNALAEPSLSAARPSHERPKIEEIVE